MEDNHPRSIRDQIQTFSGEPAGGFLRRRRAPSTVPERFAELMDDVSMRRVCS